MLGKTFLSGKKTFDKATLLLLLCWVVYACSYIGKLSFSANINQIGAAYNESYARTGMVSTFFFFAYGIGQIVNGFLCKKYHMKLMVFAALLVGGAMNVLVAFSPSFSLLKYFWLINGVAMSFLWPIFVRLLSETMKKENIGKAIIAMGTTVAAGTLLVYGFSAFFAAFLDYRYTFCVAAISLFIISLVWLFSYDFLVTDLKKECEMEEKEEREAEKDQKGSGLVLTKKMLGILVCVLAFFAVSNNFIKDGLTAWTPDILSSLYNTPGWLSILLTLLLPLLAIPGTVLAVKLYDFVKDFIGTCTFLFFVSALLMAVVIACLGGSYSALVVTIASFSLISALMAGVNNVIGSMVPLYLKGQVNSGKLAGILNGFCYAGSTVSSYGLGAVADHFGWKAVFFVLLGVTACVIAVGVIYRLVFGKTA